MAGPPTTVPPLTAKQRSAALEQARVVNSLRRRWLDRLRSGDLPPEVALGYAVRHDVLRGVRVRTFLLAIPEIRKHRTRSIMTSTDIPDCRRLGGLSEKKQQQLIAAIADTLSPRRAAK